MLKWLGIKLLQAFSFKHKRKAATQFAKRRARLELQFTTALSFQCTFQTKKKQTPSLVNYYTTLP